MKKIVVVLFFVLIISSVSFAVTIPSEDVDYSYDICTFRLCPATFTKDFHYEDSNGVIDYKANDTIYVIKEEVNSSSEYEYKGAVVFVDVPTVDNIRNNQNAVYKENIKINNNREFVVTCGVPIKKYTVSNDKGAKLFLYPYTSSKLLKTLDKGTSFYNARGELFYNFYDKKYMDEDEDIYVGFKGQEFWVYTGEGFVSSNDLTSESGIEFKEILKVDGIVSKDFSRDGLEIPANTIVQRVVLEPEDDSFGDITIQRYLYDGKYLSDSETSSLGFTVIDRANLAWDSKTGDYYLLNDNQMQYKGETIDNRLIVDTAEIGVFKQADYDSDIIGVLHRSEAVDIKYYDRDVDWIGIDFNGTPGYVPTENMILVEHQLYIYIPGETPTKKDTQNSGDTEEPIYSGDVKEPDEPVEPDEPLPKDDENKIDSSVVIKGILVISFFILLFLVTQVIKKPR